MVYIWLVLAGMFAIMNWIFTAKQQRRLQFVFNVAALAALITWFSAQGEWQGNLAWFGMGLVFGLAGDILLELPSRFFIFGLGAFLLGHMCYVAGFLSAGIRLSAVSGLVAVLVVVGAGMTFVRLVRLIVQKPENSAMRLPVILYAVVITAMVVCATLTLADPSWQWPAAVSAAMGAILFIVSDTILAYQLFVRPFRFSGPVVMVTYHLAQGLIAFGALLGAS